MSESSFRRVARTGLAPLLEDVPEGPAWTDLNPETALAPSTSARFGWLAGVGAAVVVLVVVGAAAFLTGEDPVPPPATDATSTTAPSSTVTTTPTTTTQPQASRAPLIGVPEMNEPRPVDPDLAASPDWTFLPSDSLSPRWPLVTAWTGEEIVVFGGEVIGGGDAFQDGAAFNVSTQEWRSIPPGPFALDNEEEWVWTGDELIIWGQGRAMAWNPLTNSWRLMDDWPLNGGFYQDAVWTGSQIIDVAQGLAVDPGSGASTPIADPPHLGGRSTAVWTGTHAVIVTGEGSYNAATDTWVDMPGLSGLTDLATSGTAVNGKVVAGDYELRAATYDPESNSWTELPDIPLRFFECAPTMQSVGDVPIFEHCSGWAALADNAWIPYSYPLPDAGWTLIPAGPDLFAWGEAGLATLTVRDAFTANADLRRLPVGIASLDVPDGWSINLVIRTSQDVWVDLETPTGSSCTVVARHALATILLGQYTVEGTEVTEVQPYVGGTPYAALENTAGLIDNRHHLSWPVGTTDLIDASCDDPTMTRVLSERIWAPWQALTGG
jgi:hypothetical protein